MASGTAVVKQVISADTIVLVGTPKGGPPPEKQICLSSLSAPRVAMKSLTKEIHDEPYGWTAREFLRNLLIGKEVEFQIEYSVSGKEYGWIKIEGESVSHIILKKGFAELRNNKAPPFAYDYEELQKCQEFAKEAKIAIWNDEPGSGLTTIRNITWAVNDVPLLKSFVEKNKNKRLKGIVEYVRDGGCMRIIFVDEMIYCSLLISGIQCDGFKRELDENNQEKYNAEPYAAEAKFFVEYRLLNRDVEVRLESSDDYGNLYGSVYHPNGNIAVLLLTSGFAKIQDWSANLTESTSDLRRALLSAQDKKLRKWKNWQPVTLSVGDEETEYQAKVREISSGDCLVVEMPDKSERRLYLASIRCPKLGGRNKESEPYAVEAKELLRKTLIGKKIKVVLEYIREPAANSTGMMLPPASDSQGRMHFVSAYLENNKNIQEILVSKGMGKLIPHRLDDKRAQNYDVLMELEKEAVTKKVGLHAPAKTERTNRVNDLTGPENSQRARSFEKQLTRHTKITGIIDYILNCGRFKIYIPTENLFIMFVLSVVRCPKSVRPTPGNKGSNDPFCDEAIEFARELLMQREVTIKVESADRRGNFFGLLWHNKTNFAVDLLENGYASISNLSEAPSSIKDIALAAEHTAKNNKLNIWSLPGALEERLDEPLEKDVDEVYPTVSITYINSILDFYVQEIPSNTLSIIIKELDEYEENASDEYSQRCPPVKGDIVIGKFTIDNQWYRARVEFYNSSANSVNLLYIDFGNFESLSLSKIRRCPKNVASLKSHPPQAKLCALAGLLQPLDLEDEAAQSFYKMVEKKNFNCRVEKYDKSKKRCVILTEKDTDSLNTVSCNELLMRVGYARLDKRSNTKIFAKLNKEEEAARKAHVNVWKYGDVGDDDDNSEEFPSLSNKK